MGKAGDVVVAAGAAVTLLLDFCGWVILLAGVSAMQYSCGSSSANLLLAGGSAGFNGAVSCDVFFSYTWWMTFYNLFVLVTSAAVLAAGALPKFRPGLVALQAIAAMQAVIIANNYLYFNDLAVESGTFVTRAQVTVAGAVIKAVASLLFLAFIGARDERETVFEAPAKREAVHGGYRLEQGPLGPPVSTNVLEPETTAVRPGRITGAPASAAAAPAGAGNTVGTTATTVSPV